MDIKALIEKRIRELYVVVGGKLQKITYTGDDVNEMELYDSYVLAYRNYFRS